MLESDLPGLSPPMRALREQIQRFLAGLASARRMPPVLLRGETGTGKGLVARLLHRFGPRAHRPFVDVNCAAIPETLLEAEMFGFERGAFTDARQAKRGLFQAAHGGTIFLDEVGLLPEGLQAKLLKAIEERSVRRLGSTAPESVDVWIVSATSGTQSGPNLREDLFYRLAGVSLWLPPLRDRGDDIVQLAEHFLTRACADYGLHAKTLGAGARRALLAHAWPGNVRELMNVMERVALLSSDATVAAEHLGLSTLPARRVDVSSGRRREGDHAGLTPERLRQVLSETGGNVCRAAARLGTTRSAVRYWKRKFDLRPDGQQVSEPPTVEAASGGAPSTPPPHSEHREVAVVRVRLEAGAGPPDPVRTIPLVRQLADKMPGFGGSVEDIGSAGLVAVFGVESTEDAAGRAVHAAMAIRKSVERHRDPGTLFVRIAIHAGRLRIIRASRAAVIDLDDKRVVWPLLDRLVAATDAGTIRVSAGTAPLIERRFELTPVSDVEGGRAYRLDGHDRPGFTLAGRITPYVGRRSEREVLRAGLARARGGRGQVIAIAGDAGIGKSRLLFELRREVASEIQSWLEGRCLAFGRGVPYLPILDLVRGACSIVESDPPVLVAERLQALLTTLRIDPVTARPFLSHLLSVADGADDLRGLTPDAIKARTFDALRETLLRCSAGGVIVVEDLHWIDGVSEEFLATLIDGVAAAPVLLLVTYRSGYPPSWITKSYVSQVTLQPLPPDESLRIARPLLEQHGVPEQVTRLVLDRADGNPFFIEELARALAAADGPPSTRVVPETVQGVLTARLDQLAPGDRRLLQTAAVIGKELPATLLVAIDEMLPCERDAALTRLQEAEFLYATRAGAATRYTFKHPLTHEVAYASLAPDARRSLHARIVDALEREHADRLEEHVETLARHARLGEVWDKAARYLYRAGERAFRRSANQEAAAFLEEAIVACDRLGDRREFVETAIDVRFLLQLALFTQGEHARIRPRLLEAQALAEALDDPRRRARAANCLATHYYVAGDHAEGLRVGRHGLAIAEGLPDRGAEIGLLIRLGHLLHAQGDLGEAETVLRRSLALLAEGSPYEHQVLNAIPSVQARTWLAWCLADLGDLEEALSQTEEARRTADSREQPYSVVMATWGLGYCHLVSGRVADAVTAFAASLDLCRAWNNAHWTPRATAGLGYARALSGSVDEGIRLLEEGTSGLDRIGLRACSPLFLTWLGEAYLSAGRWRDAAQSARRAADRARVQGERGLEAYAARLVAQVEQSEPQYHAVIELASSLGMRPLADRCRQELAGLQPSGVERRVDESTRTRPLPGPALRAESV